MYQELVHFDILTAVKRTVIPKSHDLGFCFPATASTRFGVLWSYARSTDYPRKPCGFYVLKSHAWRNLYVLC